MNCIATVHAATAVSSDSTMSVTRYVYLCLTLSLAPTPDYTTLAFSTILYVVAPRVLQLHTNVFMHTLDTIDQRQVLMSVDRAPLYPHLPYSVRVTAAQHPLCC
jgi:hypothetical protein